MIGHVLAFIAGALAFFLALGLVVVCLYAVPALVRLPINTARLWLGRTTKEND